MFQKNYKQAQKNLQTLPAAHEFSNCTPTSVFLNVSEQQIALNLPEIDFFEKKKEENGKRDLATFRACAWCYRGFYILSEQKRMLREEVTDEKRPPFDIFCKIPLSLSQSIIYSFTWNHTRWRLIQTSEFFPFPDWFTTVMQLPEFLRNITNIIILLLLPHSQNVSCMKHEKSILPL